MLLGLLTMCIVVMRCFPETLFARLLQQALVDAPLAWFSKLRRRDVIFLLVTMALVLVAGEYLAIFGPAELLVYSLDLSIYLDALAVTAAIAAAGLAAKAVEVFRPQLSRWCASALKRFRMVGREPRSRSGSATQKSLEAEDDPAGAFAFAIV